MRAELAARLQADQKPEIYRASVTKDIAPVRDLLVLPRRTVNVPVTVPRTYGEFNNSLIGVSVRSRDAQRGINIDQIAAERVHRASLHRVDTAVVTVSNETDRAQKLTASTGFFKLWGVEGERFLDNSELDILRDEGSIQLTGEQGVDWDWYVGKDKDPKKNRQGIKLRLHPEKRFWIPFRNEPIEVPLNGDATSHEVRADLAEKVLKPFPTEITATPAGKPQLIVSQTTSEAYFSEDVIGIIDPSQKDNRRHVNSVALYGGNTKDWHLRTEHVVAHGEKFPEFLVVYFALMKEQPQ